MNTLKRIFATALCLLLILTCLAGCHQKGEIAVKIGDVEFTSGYYACALVFSDNEARAMVEEDLSEKGDLPDEINYWDYKVEDTDYVEWVQTNTLDTLKDLAAVKTLCKEADVQLDAETISLAESNADYLWDSYGYSALLEGNGVSETTFRQYMQDTYLADTYFEHIYGKGGEKEISADKLTEQLTGNYALVNIIKVDFSGLKADQIADKKEQLSVYETALKNGTKTFEEIYLEYNGISAEDHTHEEVEEGESEPLDHHATILGSEDTDYASDYYEDAKAMATGEVKVVTKDESSMALIVKQDIVADPYYIEELDTTLRNDIAGEDYQDEIAEYGEGLDCDVNTSSTKQFKVKKIKYPETTY